MTDVRAVIVETSWIIDVALGHDDASVELLGHARAGRVHVLLPTFCVAEATKTVESKQRELTRMRAEVLPRLDLTAGIYNALTLSPADSSVLASAVIACWQGQCRVFMSRDRDFAQEPVREHMTGEGLTFLDSAHPIVGPLRA